MAEEQEFGPEFTGGLDDQVSALIGQSNRLGDRTAVQLAASDAAGGVLAWRNPTGKNIMVDDFVVRVTTPSTGACTVDFGVAADAITSNDGLCDGLSVAAAGVFANDTDGGTNGKRRQIVGPGQYITGSMSSGATAGLAGVAYIKYYLVS